MVAATIWRARIDQQVRIWIIRLKRLGQPDIANAGLAHSRRDRFLQGAGQRAFSGYAVVTFRFIPSIK
jgi:hypothetical protein